MVCLRIELDGQPTPYAAFIDSEPPRVRLLRRTVRIDECGQDQYGPLVVVRPPVEKSFPAPRKKMSCGLFDLFDRVAEKKQAGSCVGIDETVNGQRS
jgi:hypothetical protein